MTLLGGVPYLEKDDDLNATWTIYGTVEIIWRGKRFGLALNFKRTYNLHSLLGVSNKQIFNDFFEELNYHLKEAKERYYLKNKNRCVVQPTVLDHLEENYIKADIATVNEVLTKTGLHHLDQLLTNGGEYEVPWIYKDCDNTDCVHTIVTRKTAGTGSI